MIFALYSNYISIILYIDFIYITLKNYRYYNFHKRLFKGRLDSEEYADSAEKFTEFYKENCRNKLYVNNVLNYTNHINYNYTTR